MMVIPTSKAAGGMKESFITPVVSCSMYQSPCA